MPCGERADLVAGGHGLSGGDGGLQRLVGGAQAVRVVDAHDASTGHAAGEMDGAGAGGSHCHTRDGGEVDATVAG
ncbi:hypothetical protein GCM10023170_031400 [Phytohabitans houttuyneae]|uniref:Uncharacterized protein n=1 Tax=Phytohabitans houttuyneae TaxID=1076126 RepID=A0A6V8KBE2_9ACTN|nr:hypothetical protein Phou_022850 [Phytohabitans houttuyneae]